MANTGDTVTEWGIKVYSCPKNALFPLADKMASTVLLCPEPCLSSRYQHFPSNTWQDHVFLSPNITYKKSHLQSAYQNEHYQTKRIKGQPDKNRWLGEQHVCPKVWLITKSCHGNGRRKGKTRPHPSVWNLFYSIGLQYLSVTGNI